MLSCKQIAYRTLFYRLIKYLIPGIYLLLICASQSIAQQKYTAAFQINQKDTFFGSVVEDPYRWMEEDSSEVLKKWVKSQQELADREYRNMAEVTAANMYLGMVRKRFTRSLIYKSGLYFGFSRILENQEPVLHVYKNERDNKGKAIFWPANLKRHPAEEIQVHEFSVSANRKYLALLISRSGSDFKEIRFCELASGKLLNETVERVRFHFTWGEEGVYYHSLINLHDTTSVEALLFHPLFPQKGQSDSLIFSCASGHALSYYFSANKKQLYILDYSKRKNQYLLEAYRFNGSGMLKFLLLSSVKNFDLRICGDLGDSLLIQSNFRANNGRLMKCAVHGLNQLSDFIPEYRELLTQVLVADKKILCLYKSKGKYFSILFNERADILHKMEYGRGCFVKFGECTPNDTLLMYKEGSYFYTPVDLFYDLRSKRVRTVNSEVEIPYDHRSFISTYVEYTSKDGNKVPMYITHLSSLKLNGKNPTILYGYGGFGHLDDPFFDPAMILFLNNSGILAHPAIRGGAEKGSLWHEEGRNLNKQNSFDDFIAAAEYLITEKYTSQEYLVAMGASNGGMLATACMVQRPDLFKVVVATNPVTDMVRFSSRLAGSYWVEEYGNIFDSLECLNLLRYSPLHNIRMNTKYPSCLLICSQNDERVAPFHSYKFIASLQNAAPHGTYVMLNTKETGHTGSSIGTKSNFLDTYRLLFIFRELNIKPEFDRY